MYHSSPGSYTQSPANRKLTVYGSSTLSIEPTICKITLGINTESKDVTTAQQENARIHQQVVKSILNLGIPSTNIQTIDYTIFPQYDYVENKQVFKSYKVTHLLSIVVETIQVAGTVIDTAVQNGANQVTSIHFDVSNRSEHYERALQKAVKDALSKAKAIANALQISIDPVPVKILEIPANSITPIPLAKMSFGEVGGISTNLEPGQLIIEAKVGAKFSY
ncbi:SIMPL domain-containing protein [Niallia sp.]|uniref:SIMPL domain-containing protein n=1 Tax=Niallia sp. TaxID=2837523 RepID=UPI0028982E6D|nr:SIMPL domain-containing protein [Niallia sp.]